MKTLASVFYVNGLGRFLDSMHSMHRNTNGAVWGAIHLKNQSLNVVLLVGSTGRKSARGETEINTSHQLY